MARLPWGRPKDGHKKASPETGHKPDGEGGRVDPGVDGPVDDFPPPRTWGSEAFLAGEPPLERAPLRCCTVHHLTLPECIQPEFGSHETNPSPRQGPLGLLEPGAVAFRLRLGQ